MKNHLTKMTSILKGTHEMCNPLFELCAMEVGWGGQCETSAKELSVFYISFLSLLVPPLAKPKVLEGFTAHRQNNIALASSHNVLSLRWQWLVGYFVLDLK